MCVIDGQSCGMASGDRCRFFTGLLLQYHESVIHRDTFNKILGAMFKDMNGGIRARPKQRYELTCDLGWTGPFNHHA